MKTDIQIDIGKTIHGINNLTEGLWRVEGRDIIVLVLINHPISYPARGFCKRSGASFAMFCEERVAFNLNGTFHYEVETWADFNYIPVYGTLTFDCRKA